MSNWKLIKPAGRINYAKNPAFFWNVTDGWDFTDGTGGSRTHDDSYQYRGPASCRIDAGSSSAYLNSSYDVSLADGETMTLSVMVRGDAVSGRIRIYDVSNTTYRDTTSLTGSGDWTRETATWTNSTGSPVDVRIYIHNDANDSSSSLYFDAVMWENGAQTTYADGDVKGCWWYGAEHNSYSERSASSRYGGLVKDLKDDYGFGVTNIIDAGVPRIENHLHPYAMLPGGEISGNKVEARLFSLSGILKQRTGLDSDIHKLRNALTDEIVPWAYPEMDGQYQPVILRYTGADEDKEIAATYEPPGLSGNLDLDAMMVQYEKLTLSWLASDPWWYGLEENGSDLSHNDNKSSTYGVVGRHKEGDWHIFGMSSVDGSSLYVHAARWNHVDGKIYVGGEFVNWDGESNQDYLIAYDPVAETWEQVGSPGDLNGTVWDIAVRANGDVYFCGEFTDAGLSNADNLAYLDLSTGLISQVAAHSGGTVTDVRCLAFDDDEGVLYFGGDFTNWGGDGGMDYIAAYNLGTGAYDTVASTGVDDVVRDIVFSKGTLYLCGDFADEGTGVASYDPDDDAFTDISTGLEADGAKALAADKYGNVYIGVTDTSFVGGLSVWNGTSWTVLGAASTVTGDVTEIHVAPDGAILLASGLGTVEGVTLGSGYRVFKYSNDSWTVLPVVMEEPLTIATYWQDGVVPNQYEIMIGQDIGGSSGTAACAAVTTINVSGNAVAWPVFMFERGDELGNLVSIENITTGQEIVMSYDMRIGERLIVDFSAGGMDVRTWPPSNKIDDAVISAPLSSMALVPGENLISIYAVVPIINDFAAAMKWRPAFAGVD